MTIRRLSRTSSSRMMFLLIFTVVIEPAALLALPEAGLALDNTSPVFNKCACLCVSPGIMGGEFLTDITNTAGLSCDAYNKKPCNRTHPDGSLTIGETKRCVGDPSGGTRAVKLPQNAPLLQPVPTTPSGARVPPTGTIQRRGVDGEQPGTPAPSEQSGQSSGTTK